MVMSDIFNVQYELGMDFNNEFGGEFFSDINGVNVGFFCIVFLVRNVGNVSIFVIIDDIFLLMVDNYNFRYDVGIGNYIFYNVDSSVNVSFVNLGVGGLFIIVDGFIINFGVGVFVDGDEFGVLFI